MNSKISKEQWYTECQAFERECYAQNLKITENNSEILKQNTYAKLLGIEIGSDDKIDLKNKKILDVGCGPISMLLRCKHFSEAVGIEPNDYGEETDLIYQKHNVTKLKICAEELNLQQQYDEIWMYDVLQHVYNPTLVLQNIKHAGNILRIFEWIDMPAYKGHPHILSQKIFIEALELKKSDFRVLDIDTPHLKGRAIVIIKRR